MQIIENVQGQEKKQSISSDIVLYSEKTKQSKCQTEECQPTKYSCNRIQYGGENKWTATTFINIVGSQRHISSKRYNSTPITVELHGMSPFA